MRGANPFKTIKKTKVQFLMSFLKNKSGKHYGIAVKILGFKVTLMWILFMI